MCTYKEIVKYRFEMDKKFIFFLKRNYSYGEVTLFLTNGLKKLNKICLVCAFLYVCVVWSPYTKRNITNLEQIQRRAKRFILGVENTEYERLSKLNLLPFH